MIKIKTKTIIVDGVTVKKVRRIKRHRGSKNFGYTDEGFARNWGRWGKKRSYGRFGGYDFRTHAEKLSAADSKDGNY